MSGFIETSTVTVNTIKRGNTAIAEAQNAVSTIFPSPSRNVGNSVFGTVNRALNDGNRNGTSAVNTVNRVANTANTVIRTADAAQHYVKDAIKSIKSTFGTPKALASGISSKFKTSFADTTVKPAAITTTRVSDPITSNLLKKKTPISTSFKIDSLQAASQIVTMAGSSSQYGSGADTMTGTVRSTLLNRFNLDSDRNLIPSLNNSFSSSKLNGLFSSVAKVTKDINRVANTVRAEVNAVQRVVYSVKQEYSAIAGLVSQAKNTFNSLTSISSLNDINEFAGNVSNLSKSVGNLNLSTYYMVNSVSSLVDQTGALINTNRSGVDAITANSLLATMRLSGCNVPDTYYTSAHGRASLFNLSLSTAATNGMMDEVNTLLGCSQASTNLGQQALANAFRDSAGTHIGTAKTILESMTSPTSVKSRSVARTILENSSLASSSVSTIDSIFTTLGTTTRKALSVSSVSSDLYPVYDTSLLASAQPSFIDAVFLDETLTDYINGSPMKVNSDGSFGTINI